MNPFATNLTYSPDSDQMVHSGEGSSQGGEKSWNRSEKKYKGIRQRKWGKWVSEVRLPRTRHRLWLGTYSTPEAAAVARDTAVFYLRGPSSIGDLNFPMCVQSSHLPDMSPLLIQKAATDAGMAVDAGLIAKFQENDVKLPESGVFESAERPVWESEKDCAKVFEESELREGEAMSISIDDMEIDDMEIYMQ